MRRVIAVLMCLLAPVSASASEWRQNFTFCSDAAAAGRLAYQRDKYRSVRDELLVRSTRATESNMKGGVCLNWGSEVYVGFERGEYVSKPYQLPSGELVVIQSITVTAVARVTPVNKKSQVTWLPYTEGQQPLHYAVLYLIHKQPDAGL